MYWRIAPPPNLSSSVILILHIGRGAPDQRRLGKCSILNHIRLAQMTNQTQKMVSDQVLIFLPSSGPKGSMLKVPRIALPHIHAKITSSRIGFAEAPINTMPRPRLQSATLVMGPASAILPN